MRTTTVIDMDQHMYEPAEMWQEYIDPKQRHLALSIRPDSLGHWWLTCPYLGRRIAYAWVSVPQDGFETMRDGPDRAMRGVASTVNYVTDVPLDYRDPKARVAKLDEFEIDIAMILPQWGCVFANVPNGVHDHLGIVRANLEAWNRRAIDIQHEGEGRLIAVGEVTLRGGDQEWLESQLRMLADGGVKTAMMAYGLHDGRPLSHRDHDRAWSAFVEHDIIPVFHVQDNGRNSSLPEAWFATDHEPLASVLEMPFFDVGIRLALGDLAINGTLERHPDLRICVVELYANWFGPFLKALDHAYDFHGRLTSRHIYDLARQPSEYLLRQVRLVAHWSVDHVPSLIGRFPDHIMFGGDYPHCEGLSSPFHDFSRRIGALPEDLAAKLYGQNAAALLGLS